MLVLFLTLALCHTTLASAVTEYDFTKSLPKSLAGRCYEGGGSGVLKFNEGALGTAANFFCTVPVFKRSEISENSEEMNVSPDFRWSSGDALKSGIVYEEYPQSRGGWKISVQQIWWLDSYVLRLYAGCHSFKKAPGMAATKFTKCDLGDIDDVLSKVSSLEGLTLKVTVSPKNISGNISYICLEKGPGYPHGPSCLKEVPVDMVSGSYCRVPGSYPGPQCLEYGNVGPKYP